MSAAQKLAATVERHAERPFLIDASNGVTLTYADAIDLALRIAGELESRGLAAGDRLAVALPNSSELALVYLAAMAAGTTVVPVSLSFGRRELREVLGRTRPQLALGTGAEAAGAFNDVVADLGIDRLAVEVGEVDGDLAPLRPAAAPTSRGFPGLADEDLASIHFTSGSTGLPRGVGHRLQSFLGNAERYSGACGLDHTHRFHHTLPMSYMAGYYNLLLLPMSIGASVVVDRAFDARSAVRFWEAPIAHEVDVLWFVPTIMAMLLRLDRGSVGRDYCRAHIRHVACGTAPLDADLRARFEQEYGVQVHDSYGLSETLLVAASTPSHPADRGAVGRVLPGIEVGVTSDDGPAGPILIRSSDNMVGYLEGCDSEDRPVFGSPAEDGWFNTGDIGIIDDQEQLRITGRAKEIIIRGGVNVSAVELERLLEGVEGVDGVSVVGVPHEVLGEEVAVVITPADDAPYPAVEARVKERVASSLSYEQRPDVYIEIDHLPMTPTGKVRKGTLRDMVIDALGLPARAKGFTVDRDDSPATGSEQVWSVPAFPAGRAVDLTHGIREGMTSFPSPNHPAPKVTILARHERDGRATRRLVLGTHTGTHADAPLHFVPGGASIDAIPIDRFVGPATFVDLSPVEELEEISRARLEQAVGRLEHPRLLLRFDWSRRFVDESFYHRSPYLSRDAVEWLLEQGVHTIGIDTPSPDDPRLGAQSADDSPNHHRLLGAGVVLLEYLANLEKISAREVFLIALPLPVVGGDGAPMRVLAVEPDRAAR